MGTNYYWYPSSPCKECGREYEPKHIGKSSAGWCFGLHVIPEENINDLPDWGKLWQSPQSEIKNEYGEVISINEMEKIITERSWKGTGERLTAEWLEENHAIKGPNNLARSRIEKWHCIGHGKGTWDLIIGEFS